MGKGDQLITLQMTSGRDVTALVKPVPAGIQVTTAFGQFTFSYQSVEEVCEKLLSFCREKKGMVG